MVTIRLRIDSKVLSKLDALARSTDRERDLLISEALANYLDAQEWQVVEILKAVKDADRGDFASSAATSRTIRKWTSLR